MLVMLNGLASCERHPGGDTGDAHSMVRVRQLMPMMLTLLSVDSAQSLFRTLSARRSGHERVGFSKDLPADADDARPTVS